MPRCDKGIVTLAGEVRSIRRARDTEEDDVPLIYAEREELQSEHRWPDSGVGRAQDALLSRCVPFDGGDLGSAVGLALVDRYGIEDDRWPLDPCVNVLGGQVDLQAVNDLLNLVADIGHQQPLDQVLPVRQQPIPG